MAETERQQAAPFAAAEAPFDAVGLARTLLRATRTGALATLDRSDGSPFASLVTVATDLDGAPLMLLSRLSAHTLNLEAEPRCSLLLSAGGKGDPLAHPRLTVAGRVERSDAPRVRARFLARHPKAQLYADFPDFAFYRLEPRAGHLNGGFAKAATLSGPELLTDLAGLEALADSEAGAVAHMNADHADAVALYAAHFAGAEPGPWRLTGLDPDGMDLIAGDRTARVTFPERLSSPATLRQVLVEMAREARRAQGGGGPAK
ncbi:HugZ family pyridoxamine 5'-phosphate oxidase [Methylobacterium sp. ID0610]|uniref:HugZ family pyridoxamine 5'-phosphate oxidase n=1 Tax=Methylobacterium carpenticola TaxID=3344827 RepID=UPI0036749C9E